MSDEPAQSDDRSHRPVCFIATPVGGSQSAERRATDGVLDSVLVPVLRELDIEAKIPHRMVSPGSITDQVIELLLTADLVVANVTGLNGNVMYELAVRHCAGQPVVVIAEEGTQLPFDIAGERLMTYANDMKGVAEMPGALKAAIEAAMAQRAPNNPVHRVKRTMKFDALVEKELDAAGLLGMMNTLRSVQVSVARLEQFGGHRTPPTPPERLGPGAVRPPQSVFAEVQPPPPLYEGLQYVVVLPDNEQASLAERVKSAMTGYLMRSPVVRPQPDGSSAVYWRAGSWTETASNIATALHNRFKIADFGVVT